MWSTPGFDEGCRRALSQGGRLMSRLQSGRVQNYLRVVGIALDRACPISVLGPQGMNGFPLDHSSDRCAAAGRNSHSSDGAKNRNVARGWQWLRVWIALALTLVLWHNSTPLPARCNLRSCTRGFRRWAWIITWGSMGWDCYAAALGYCCADVDCRLVELPRAGTALLCSCAVSGGRIVRHVSRR